MAQYLSVDEKVVVEYPDRNANGNPLILEEGKFVALPTLIFTEIINFRIIDISNNQEETNFYHQPVIIYIGVERPRPESIWVWDDNLTELRIYPQNNQREVNKLKYHEGSFNGLPWPNYYTLTVRSLPDGNVGWGGSIWTF